MFFSTLYHYLSRLSVYYKNGIANLEGKCAVLIFHRVYDLEKDPQLLTVNLRNFEDQVKHLKENYNVISLQSLIHKLTGHKKIPGNSVVITFDDGYADNYLYAFPILEKYKVPATIFVTSGHIDKPKEYWWNELERIFLIDPPKKELNITINFQELNFVIKTDRDARNAYYALHPLLKELSESDRNQKIDDLFKWTNKVRTEIRDSHRSLSSAEIKTLSKNPLIEIGAHTVTHPCLRYESIENLEFQIFNSKKSLSSLLNKEIRSFSYPFGGKTDYDDTIVSLVKSAGYNCGISNFSGLVSKQTDPYQIPRYLVRDWDLNGFQEFTSSIFVKKRSVTQAFFENEIIQRVYFTFRLKNAVKASLAKHKSRKPFENSSLQFKSVLHVNYLDIVGGAAQVAYALHKGVKDLGKESRMLVQNAYSKDADVQIIQKSIKRNDLEFQRWLNLKGIRNVYYSNKTKIKDHSFFINSNIVHFHNLHTDFFSILDLPQITALKPVVWTLHDMHAITGHCAHSFDCERWETGCGNCPDLTIYPSLEKDSTNSIWNLKKDIYANSKLTIVCPSMWLFKKVKKSILKDQDIFLIPNGIDTKIFRNTNKQIARKILDLETDKFIFLFSAEGGKSNTWKGFKHFERLYEELGENPSNLFITLGNSKFSERGNWINYDYISSKHELALFYSAADLFIYPSLADNCPLAILEAMSCGLPVVTFNTGGIPEIVEHLQSGYIAEYDNFESFYQGALYFINDRENLHKASVNSISTIQKKYTLEMMIGKYNSLYQNILRSNESTTLNRQNQYLSSRSNNVENYGINNPIEINA